MDLFKEWHNYLEGTSISVIIYINHKNLEYFISISGLNFCKFY